jgi:hypothetical protein
MGGVVSHAEGFRSIGEMLPGFAFHMVCMAGGLTLFARAKASVQVRQAA